MSNVVTINNVDLPIKEFNSERVITFKDMDMLHQRKEGSAKRNFMNNRDKFIENEDYFMITVKEYRELFSPNKDAQRGNPNLNVILLTEMGYLMLVKTFSDQLAWSVQRALVTNYFRFKQVSTTIHNEFDVMRKMIDMMEESKLREAEMQRALVQMQNQIDSLETSLLDTSKFNQDIITTEIIKASDIAHQLKLYTVNGLPHNRIIGAIARKLGFKINIKNYYEDDYIVIMKEGDSERTLTWQVYYKPEAVNQIIAWFNSNKEDIYYELHYKNKTKKGNPGEIKEAGYKVGGVNWAVAH